MYHIIFLVAINLHFFLGVFFHFIIGVDNEERHELIIQKDVYKRQPHTDAGSCAGRKWACVSGHGARGTDVAGDNERKTAAGRGEDPA